MKKFLVLGILLVVFGLVFSFCSSNSSTENNPNETSMWDNAIEKTIVGKIETGDKKIFVVEKWDSKSRVSYEVFGDLAKELEPHIDKYAKVKGLVPRADEETINWSKHILVQEIIEIYENPPTGDNN